MKQFEGKLICVDLDGTLLKNDGTVSDENIKAIEYFKKNGGLFTLITGRMPSTATYIFDKVKPNAPVGCINGGGIYDYEKKEFIRTIPLKAESIELVKYVDEKLPHIGIQTNTAKNIYLSKENRAMTCFHKNTHIPNVYKKFNEVEEEVLKYILTEDDDEKMLELISLLNSHPLSKNFDLIRTQHDLFEILPKGVNKGNAIKDLAEISGVDIKNTIAMGDYDNDVEMLIEAGLGVAVANASKKAKNAADLITVSNEEDAVKVIIENLENGRL